ncbi:unnamed protein product, partial [Amoebophrya sp. A25]
ETLEHSRYSEKSSVVVEGSATDRALASAAQRREAAVSTSVPPQLVTMFSFQRQSVLGTPSVLVSRDKTRVGRLLTFSFSGGEFADTDDFRPTFVFSLGKRQGSSRELPHCSAFDQALSLLNGTTVNKKAILLSTANVRDTQSTTAARSTLGRDAPGNNNTEQASNGLSTNGGPAIFDVDNALTNSGSAALPVIEVNDNVQLVEDLTSSGGNHSRLDTEGETSLKSYRTVLPRPTDLFVWTPSTPDSANLSPAAQGATSSTTGVDFFPYQVDAAVSSSAQSTSQSPVPVRRPPLAYHLELPFLPATTSGVVTASYDICVRGFLDGNLHYGVSDTAFVNVGHSSPTVFTLPESVQLEWRVADFDFANDFSETGAAVWRVQLSEALRSTLDLGSPDWVRAISFSSGSLRIAADVAMTAAHAATRAQADALTDFVQTNLLQNQYESVELT